MGGVLSLVDVGRGGAVSHGGNEGHRGRGDRRRRRRCGGRRGAHWDAQLEEETIRERERKRKEMYKKGNIGTEMEKIRTVNESSSREREYAHGLEGDDGTSLFRRRGSLFRYGLFLLNWRI